MSVEKSILLAGLETALTNPHPAIRRCAVRNLGKMGRAAETKLPLLLNAAKDENPRVRKAVYEALPCLSDSEEVLQTLEEALSDADRSTHGEAVMALAHVPNGTSTTLAKLFNCLQFNISGDEKDSTYWHWLAGHLSETLLAGGYFRPTLEFLAAFSDTRERVRWVVAYSLTSRVRGRKKKIQAEISAPFLSVIEARLKQETTVAVLELLLNAVYQRKLPLSAGVDERILELLDGETSRIRALSSRIASARGLDIPSALLPKLQDDERRYRRDHETFSI